MVASTPYRLQERGKARGKGSFQWTTRWTRDIYLVCLKALLLSRNNSPAIKQMNAQRITADQHGTRQTVHLICVWQLFFIYQSNIWQKRFTKEMLLLNIYVVSFFCSCLTLSTPWVFLEFFYCLTFISKHFTIFTYSLYLTDINKELLQAIK